MWFSSFSSKARFDSTCPALPQATRRGAAVSPGDSVCFCWCPHAAGSARPIGWPLQASEKPCSLSKALSELLSDVRQVLLRLSSGLYFPEQELKVLAQEGPRPRRSPPRSQPSAGGRRSSPPLGKCLMSVAPGCCSPCICFKL